MFHKNEVIKALKFFGLSDFRLMELVQILVPINARQKKYN